jgi:ATP-dependent RNA helicase DDX5/DBP2
MKKNQSKNLQKQKKENIRFINLFLIRLAKVLAAVMRDQDCKVIIFAQTKKRVDDFFFTIKRLGYPVFPIHGDKRQQERDRVLQGLLFKIIPHKSFNLLFFSLEFRNRSRVILIATDVAARGLGMLFALISPIKQD